MKLLEEMIAYIYSKVVERGSHHLDRHGLSVEVPEIPFQRLKYEEVIEIARIAEPDIQWGDDLSTAAEKAVGEHVGEHYFIVDWPTSIKPYYTMPYEDDPEVSKSFDLMHPRMELASGAQRVHNHDLLVKRIIEQGLNPDSFDFYLRAFKYGMPPHAGWGVGVERLLMTMLDLKNIRECVLFPRDRRRVTP